MALTDASPRSPLSSLLPLLSSNPRKKAPVRRGRPPPGRHRGPGRPRCPQPRGAFAVADSGPPPCPPASRLRRRPGVLMAHPRLRTSRPQAHDEHGARNDEAPRRWSGRGCARPLRRSPALGGQAVPAAQTARSEDGTARPRGHAVPETVVLRPFPDVGLVSSLHVPSFLPGPAGEMCRPGRRAASHGIALSSDPRC